MTSLQMTISADVLQKFTALEISVLVCSGKLVDNSDDKTLLEVSAKAAADKLRPFASLADHPTIIAWRSAYGAMGVKPSKFKSSIEALARRALKGDQLALDVPLVNLYNAMSLKWLAPIGACDLAKLRTREITLRFADKARDRFDPLGSQPEAFPLSDSLVVYANDAEVLCWGFNCRDSRSTALSATTSEMAFFSEAATPAEAGASASALRELAGILSKAGFACAPVVQVNGTRPTMDIGG